MKPPRILIIAGSDSGGGAGIQADIKTVTMLGGYATTAVTAITAQNTRGVEAVFPIPPSMVVRQIDAVVGDIGVDAVKIGMIGSAETAATVAARLERLADVPIIFDPVMVATSGAVLADTDTIAAFERLMAIAALITPNAPELTALTGLRIQSVEQLESAGRLLAERVGVPVLAKGGHVSGAQVTDLLIPRSGAVVRWDDERIDTRHTHGTGCSLASAIAVGLARRQRFPRAISAARDYVREGLKGAPGLGAGQGPIGHVPPRVGRRIA